MAYYYLMSSLPMLKADGEMPMSYEEFLNMCKLGVSDDTFATLADLSFSSKEGSFLSKWADFYENLKAELTYQRNQRLEIKTKVPTKRDEAATKAVAQALSCKNPLEAEKLLLSMEFQKLDELVGVHYFDDTALIGYALKLKLLERKSIFKEESGKAEFNRILNKLEEEIKSMERE